MKTINVFYSAYQLPVLCELHQKLLKKLSIKPVYALTDSQYELEFSEKFNDCVFHSIYASRNGLPAKEFENIQLCYMSDELELFADSFKDMAFEMMGRQSSDAWIFSYKERNWFFIWLVNYWNTVVQNTKPNVLLSRNIPHFATEYVLFNICKFYNIPCFTFEDVSLISKSYVINGIDNRAKRIADLVGKQEYTLSSVAKEKIDLVTKDFNEAIPSYYKRARSNAKNEKSVGFLIGRFIKDVAYVLLGNPLRIVPSNIKMSKSPVYNPRSFVKAYSSRSHQWKSRFIIYKNQKYYSNLCALPNYSEKYVFFAPTYQPERTSFPDAKKFNDNILLIDILESCVPDDCLIYYKEHPSNFSFPGKDYYRGHLFRSEEYYERIGSYKKIRFIDKSVDPFKLIDNSLAVVTPTGTAAYQASMRGKPAIIFGETWFSACEAIYRYYDRKGLKEFFDMVENGYRPKLNQWYEYFAALEQIVFDKGELLINDEKNNNGESVGVNQSVVVAIVESIERELKLHEFRCLK